MERITADERRARLARRHALAPGFRASDPVEAAGSVVCLHATDPATVYLSARARMREMAVADLDRALYEERSVVKHLAMRRTLFVFPRATLPVAQAGASERVADFERRRLIRDVEKAGLHSDGERWLRRAWKAVLGALSDGREASSSELRAELPLLEGTIRYGEGRSWGGRMPIAPRVMTTLSAAAKILRANNDGGWYVSRPRWAAAESWLGEPLEPPATADGVAGLVECWLRSFGPGTEEDVRWWLGSTKTAVRKALADVGAVEVELDGAERGYVLPGDLEPTEPVESWAALLPSLDPTTMGWAGRDWYLGSYRPELFDTAGNAGPTVWWNGRIVGGWRQTETGEVELQLLEDIGRDGRAAVEHEASALTDWLGGKRVMPRFPSPLAKARAAR